MKEVLERLLVELEKLRLSFRFTENNQYTYKRIKKDIAYYKKLLDYFTEATNGGERI